MSATDALPAYRRARVARATLETRIELAIDLDGGPASAATGVPFLDHMLDALSRHGRLGLDVRCDGDTAIDAHHTVEDVGIALGQGLREALGDRDLTFTWGGKAAALLGPGLGVTVDPKALERVTIRKEAVLA